MSVLSVDDAAHRERIIRRKGLTVYGGSAKQQAQSHWRVRRAVEVARARKEMLAAEQADA